MAVNLSTISLRSKQLIGKYSKYDVDHTKERLLNSDDPFMSELHMIRTQIDHLNQRAVEVSAEQNQAAKATGYAELRRAKNNLTTIEVPRLQKLLKKGRGITPQMVQQRTVQISQLVQEIGNIADGTNAGPTPLRPVRPQQGAPGQPFGKGRKHGDVTINMEGAQEYDAAYYEATPEAMEFRAEWHASKNRQDKHLERIGRGVDELKEVAKAQEDALARGNPILDALDERVDEAHSTLKNNNRRLKEVLGSVRSSRNFCIDVILVCVLLGLAAYIYNLIA
ncbi:unnamed protein product [Pedinophyceae sp. YPF-701]|nr:unnamed protein product [Pedinophyceae sp. YPF-701]